MVESPNRDKFFDEFIKENPWEKDDPETLRKYLTELNQYKRKIGEIGTGVSKLNTQIKKFSGCTERAILKASKHPDFEHFKNKYAANVPHLMIYPSNGLISVTTVNAVEIGHSARKKV